MLFNAEEKKSVEAYQMLIRLFESIHIDNMKILKALIYAKDDLQPLVDGSTKRRVGFSSILRLIKFLASDNSIVPDFSSGINRLTLMC